MDLKLIVLAGAKQGLEIPLKKEKFLIGRAKECALRAASEAISRQHCAIVRANSVWTAQDLGSRNGTYVNDERITTAVPLSPGDELRVGPLKFRVAPVVPAAAPATAPPASSAAVEKPSKQPPVKDVADVVQRTLQKAESDTSEEDVSRWLLGTLDVLGESMLKETRTIRLEETTVSRPMPSGESATIEDVSALLAQAEQQEAAEAAAAGDSSADQKGGWNIFKRGKPPASKQKPGKLPPRPDAPTKDSREAAADILREMTRRR